MAVLMNTTKLALFALLSLLAFLAQSDAIRVSKIPMDEVSEFEAALMGGEPTCCPDSPTRYCDFYFDNYLHIVPNFHLKDGITQDHAISPTDLSSLNWKGSLDMFSPNILDAKTQNAVLVSSSWMNGTLLQCPIPLNPYINAGNQFYVTGDQGTGIAKLYVRQFPRGTRHQHGIKFYYGRCILLPLTRISITNTDVELDHEDGNTLYPEKRRCIVFRTQP